MFINLKLLFFFIFIFINIECNVINEKVIDDDNYKDFKNINNFIVLKIGGGYSDLMNNLTYSRHDKYNKYLNNIPIVNIISNFIFSRTNLHFKDIVKNIKKYGIGYFFTDFNLNLDIFYNKNIYKKFFLVLGASSKIESKLIKDEYLKNLKIYLNEFNEIKLNDKLYDNNIEDDDVKKDYLKGLLDEYDSEKDCFDYISGQSKNFDVLSMLIGKVGGVFGISYLHNNLDYANSFFINILLFIRYRRLLSFTLEEKNKDCDKQKFNLHIENQFLRINPFDVSLGIELGKKKISFLIEFELLSALQSLSKVTSREDYIVEQKNKISLRNLSLSIRYNKY